MKLHFLDPFADVTIVVICDVAIFTKNELLFKVSRSIAKKAEKYLKESGIGDTCFFESRKLIFLYLMM